jgi:hypothetical protein
LCDARPSHEWLGYFRQRRKRAIFVETPRQNFQLRQEVLAHGRDAAPDGAFCLLPSASSSFLRFNHENRQLSQIVAHRGAG